VILPWFRGGDEVHYISYLSKYGKTSSEVMRTWLTQPGLLLGDLLNARTFLYALWIIVPLGFVPLLSPGRLAVALPTFALLCLNELTQGDIYPRHHFHAPLVPIVVWACAAGLGNVPRVWNRVTANRARWQTFPETVAAWTSHFVWTSALTTGILISMGPLGRQFWDPGSDYYWRNLYVPGQRAAMFSHIAERIPLDSRVASTDFVHPRFTHHERSYDYSEYPRAVNDNKPGAPPDTDYIVIDTRHRYSKIKRPEQVPEYANHPHDWQLWPDTTDGYFIVLERKREANQQPSR
jgi:uncharacterized membrane protein